MSLPSRKKESGKSKDGSPSRKSSWFNLGLLTFVATALGTVAGILALPQVQARINPPTATALPTVSSSTNTPQFTPTEAVAATVTLTPVITVLPTATTEPSKAPSSTNVPSATEAPTAVPVPPTASCPNVNGVFAIPWSQVQTKIGCARGQAINGLVVEENFQSGRMMWRQPIDYAQALVLFSNGIWTLYRHAPFVEGSADYPCSDANTPAQSPPTPRRGFGTMWCDISAIRNGLGNATDAERGFTGSMQEFDRGFMIQTDYDASFIFYSSGVWDRK